MEQVFYKGISPLFFVDFISNVRIEVAVRTLSNTERPVDVESAGVRHFSEP